MGELTVHTGTWTLDDRFASPWHYLPVEVAPGTAALRVELEYERAGAVLDLGCLGPSGFRGWSGGARESFVIAAEAAEVQHRSRALVVQFHAERGRPGSHLNRQVVPW